MSIAFQTLTIPSGSTASATFEGTVKSAFAAIQGFHAWYATTDRKGREHPVDHHIQDFDVLASVVSIADRMVHVRAVAGYSDLSGAATTGDVKVLVIAELS